MRGVLSLLWRVAHPVQRVNLIGRNRYKYKENQRLRPVITPSNHYIFPNSFHKADKYIVSIN